MPLISLRNVRKLRLHLKHFFSPFFWVLSRFEKCPPGSGFLKTAAGCLSLINLPHGYSSIPRPGLRLKVPATTILRKLRLDASHLPTLIFSFHLCEHTETIITICVFFFVFHPKISKLKTKKKKRKEKLEEKKKKKLWKIKKHLKGMNAWKNNR